MVERKVFSAFLGAILLSCIISSPPPEHNNPIDPIFDDKGRRVILYISGEDPTNLYFQVSPIDSLVKLSIQEARFLRKEGNFTLEIKRLIEEGEDLNIAAGFSIVQSFSSWDPNKAYSLQDGIPTSNSTLYIMEFIEKGGDIFHSNVVLYEK